MYAKQAAIGLLVFALSGCTSFRTTALYRMDNDSVTAECPNKKLKGLPVKLKVPSHVRVSIYENQVILAKSDAGSAQLAKAANDAAAKVEALNLQIKNAREGLPAAAREAADAKSAQDEAKMRFDAATAWSADRRIAEADLTVATNLRQKADAALTTAEQAFASIPDLSVNLTDAQGELAIAKANLKVGYTLVSFSPPQLYVDSNLEYTDKVFLVDFRRPAGGILNLTEASMDDEQYFSKIQADVTERTLQDIGTALDTLKGPLTPTKKPATNKATPTSANSTGNENSDTVNFQKSLVASQRFDISEPDWEARMMDFVNLHLGCGTVNQIENGLLMTPAPAK